MFRKRKAKNKNSIRQRERHENKEEEKENVRSESGHDLMGKAQEDKDELESLSSHNKRRKMTAVSNISKNGESSMTNTKSSSSILHSYKATLGGSSRPTEQDLATSTAQYVGQNSNNNNDSNSKDVQKKKINPNYAGPIRAATFVRTTARFDYQPDICKDYKETGFCGYGDSCIYLHDRGDTLSGWQLEQQWEQEKEAKRKREEAEMQAFAKGETATTTAADPDSVVTDDGLPFACFLCRKPFQEPVIVTRCHHYFCQACLLQHFSESSNNNNTEQRQQQQLCPICQKDTQGVMNYPTKLIKKKKRIVGNDGSWQDFANHYQQPKTET